MLQNHEAPLRLSERFPVVSSCLIITPNFSRSHCSVWGTIGRVVSHHPSGGAAHCSSQHLSPQHPDEGNSKKWCERHPGILSSVTVSSPRSQWTSDLLKIFWISVILKENQKKTMVLTIQKLRGFLPFFRSWTAKASKSVDVHETITWKVPVLPSYWKLIEIRWWTIFPHWYSIHPSTTYIYIYFIYYTYVYIYIL